MLILLLALQTELHEIIVFINCAAARLSRR